MELTPEQIQAYRDSADAARDLATSLKYGAKAGDDYTKSEKYRLDQLKQAGGDFLTSMRSGAQGASAFNNIISAGSKVVGSFVEDIPLVGTALKTMGESAGAYVVAVNKQSDALFKSFQDLSKVGGSSKEGMQGVFDGMQKLGYTLEDLDKYRSIISENSTLMASLGGTVSQGIKAFTAVSKGIQETGLQTEFLRMGMTVEDINKGQANYLRIQQQTGQLQGKSTEALTTGTAEYLRKQSELSRLTGLSIDQLAKKFEEDQKNERFNATMTELKMKSAAGDKDAANKLAYYTELVQKAATMPEEVREGIRDTISGFGQQTEAGQKFARMSAGAADMISKGSGDVSTVLTTLGTDAKNQREATAGYVKAVGDQSTYFKQSTLLAIEGFNQSGKSAEANAAAAEKERQDLIDGKNVDINNRVAMQQAQVATTTAMQNLIELGVHPVGEAMRKLASGMEQTITKIPGTGDLTSVKEKKQGAYTTLPGEIGMGGYTIDPQIVRNNEQTLKGIQTNMEGFESILKKSITTLDDLVSIDNLRRFAGSSAPVTTTTASVSAGSQASGIAALISRFSGTSNETGPNDRVQTRLENTRPENYSAPATGSTAAGTPADIGQGFLSIAQSMGMQTQSMIDMVDLMRKSVDLQGRILQQARN